MTTYQYAGNNPIMGNDPMGNIIAAPRPNPNPYAQSGNSGRFEDPDFYGDDDGFGGDGGSGSSDNIGRHTDPNWENDGAFDDEGPFSSDRGQAGRDFWAPAEGSGGVLDDATNPGWNTSVYKGGVYLGGVLLIYSQASIGVGWMKGEYTITQSGEAWDHIGETHFDFSQTITLSDESANELWGLDLSISGGVTFDWSSDNWAQVLGEGSSLSLPTLQAGLGVGVSDNALSLSFGLGVGAIATNMTMNTLESISLTTSERDQILNLTNSSNPAWTIIGITATVNNLGITTGYSGTVSAIDQNDNIINTGVRVNSPWAYGPNGIEPSQIWSSPAYKSAVNNGN